MRAKGAMSNRHAAALLLAFVWAAMPHLGQAVEGEVPASDGACGLITDEEVRAVQEAEVIERIASTGKSVSFQVLQCVYRTGDLVHSVSVALSVPVAGKGGEGARGYWMERFHPEKGATATGEEAAVEDEEGERDRPPLGVDDLGEEAFWVGDTKSGSLYVLTGDSFLRISVGGVRDETARRQRAGRLAELALSRVRASAAGS